MPAPGVVVSTKFLDSVFSEAGSSYARVISRHARSFARSPIIPLEFEFHDGGKFPQFMAFACLGDDGMS